MAVHEKTQSWRKDTDKDAAVGAALGTSVSSDPVKWAESELVPVQIRLPKLQKEQLQTYLRTYKGQKLASGIREIITQHMIEHGI